MGDNVNKVVKLFETRGILPEGEIRIKDLKAAADLLGEPIFVSKGKTVSSVFGHKYEGLLFEKNLLLDFIAVRDKFIELLKDAVYCIDKRKIYYDEFGNFGFINRRFEGLEEHIKHYYHVFYPKEIKGHIKNVVKKLWETIRNNYKNDGIEEDETFLCGCSIDEEVFWLANAFTKQFVEALKNCLNEYGFAELDVDSGLCHNGVNGIKIDLDNNFIEFYAYLTFYEKDGNYTLRYKYVADFCEMYRNDNFSYNDKNEYF